MVKPRWGVGRAFRFHGSYTSLILARRKERAIPDAFIHEKDGRYYVLQPKRIITRRENAPRGNPGRSFGSLPVGTKFYFQGEFAKSHSGPYYKVRRFGAARRSDDPASVSVREAEMVLVEAYPPPRRENPAKSTRKKASKRVAKIYGRVLRIEAQKVGPHHCDAECKRCKHKYFHDFKVGPEMIGLTPGQVFKVPAGCWPLLIMC